MNLKMGSHRLVVGMLFWLSLAVCAAETIPPMHVRITPDVRKQIEQMPTQEKARADKAMKIAQRFLTMRFAGQDLVADSVLEDSQRWDRRVAPLMAMDGFQWMLVHERERWTEGYSFKQGNQRISGQLISCDVAALIELEAQEGGYALTYQSRLVWPTPNDVKLYTTHFGTGEAYRITVVLNKNLKVSSLVTPNKITALNVKDQIEYYKAKLRQQYSKGEIASFKTRIKELENMAHQCASSQ